MLQRQTVLQTLLLIGLACSSACTLTPRDGALITSRTQSYSGYHATPNDRISIQVMNRSTQAWEELGFTQSSSSAAYTDPCGRSWYPWQKTVTLPLLNNTSPYWDQISSGLPPPQITTRVASQFLPPMYSFGTDKDACINARTCADKILTECGNSNGVVRLFCPGPSCR
jgi:hypothetical protein